MAIPELESRFDERARSQELAVEKGTVRRGETYPEIQAKLTFLGDVIGRAMQKRGEDVSSLAGQCRLEPDDVIAIRYGVATVFELRDNLPALGTALGISPEQIDPRVLEVIWPEDAAGWLIP